MNKLIWDTGKRIIIVCIMWLTGCMFNRVDLMSPKAECSHVASAVGSFRIVNLWLRGSYISGERLASRINAEDDHDRRLDYLDATEGPDDRIDIKIDIVDSQEENNIVSIFALTLGVLPVFGETIHNVSFNISSYGNISAWGSVEYKTQWSWSLLPWGYLPILWHDDGWAPSNAHAHKGKTIGAWEEQQIANAINSLLDAAFYQRALAYKTACLKAKKEKELAEKRAEVKRREEIAARERAKEEPLRALADEFKRSACSVDGCDGISKQWIGTTRPRKGVAYPLKRGAQVISVTDEGVLVDVKKESVLIVDISDGTVYFIEGAKGYVDNDGLRRGWYVCTGTYQYVTRTQTLKTVFKFKQIEPNRGDEVISELDHTWGFEAAPIEKYL